MDPKDIRTLKILEKVDNGMSPSQRDLAGDLNISLGLVNSFIKRLVKKGFVKITTIPKKRIKYILTPRGAAEKTRRWLPARRLMRSRCMTGRFWRREK